MKVIINIKRKDNDGIDQIPLDVLVDVFIQKFPNLYDDYESIRFENDKNTGNQIVSEIKKRFKK